MLALKIYRIGNLDGTRSAIVAATSYAEAAKAIGCTTHWLKSEGGILDNPTMAGDCYPLVVATPGIAWRREIQGRHGEPPPQWTCLDPVAGAKAIVRARFPDGCAVQTRIGGKWEVWKINNGECEFASADTEDAAWIEAARIIQLDPPGLPDNAIVVWRHEDAPECFRELEPDDVDWIAFVPSRFDYYSILWLRVPPFATNGNPRRFPVRRGEVWIATH